jgi:outer membrane protein W
MKQFIQLGAFAVVSSFSSWSLAEDASPSAARSSVVGTAPSRAFELTLSAGFAQGFGDVSKAAHISDFARDGGSLQLGLGYRLNPRLMVGLYAEGTGYDHGDLSSKDARVVGASAGVQVQWHFRPFRKVDPWLSAGVGWRGYWETENDSVTRSLQGVDSLRLQAGVDYRLAPKISISPVFGLSIARFFAEKHPGQSYFREIDSPQPGVFLFAGAMGRFDFGGLGHKDVKQVASR